MNKLAVEIEMSDIDETKMSNIDKIGYESEVE
jgi:hypothetical protein